MTSEGDRVHKKTSAALRTTAFETIVKIEDSLTDMSALHFVTKDSTSERLHANSMSHTDEQLPIGHGSVNSDRFKFAIQTPPEYLVRNAATRGNEP